MGFTNGIPTKLIKRINEIEIDSFYYDNTIVPSKQEFFKFKLIEDPNKSNQYIEAHIIGLSDLGKTQSIVSIPYKYKYGDETSEMYVPVTQLYYINSSNEEITNIFEGCTNLIHIDIPSSISKIPQKCFKGCTKLESISLSKSIKMIESNAFEDCVNLGSTYIGHEVIAIGDDVFKNCSDKLSILCHKYSVTEEYCKNTNIKYSLISYTLDEHVTKSSTNMVTSGMVYESDDWLNDKIDNHLNDKMTPHDNSKFSNTNLSGTTIISAANITTESVISSDITSLTGSNIIATNLKVNNNVNLSKGILNNIYKVSDDEKNDIKTSIINNNSELTELQINDKVTEEVNKLNESALINKRYVDDNDSKLNDKIINLNNQLDINYTNGFYWRLNKTLNTMNNLISDNTNNINTNLSNINENTNNINELNTNLTNFINKFKFGSINITNDQNQVNLGTNNWQFIGKPYILHNNNVIEEFTITIINNGFMVTNNITELTDDYMLYYSIYINN